VVGALLPALDGPLFSSRAAPAEPTEAPPLAAVALAPSAPGKGQSAFLVRAAAPRGSAAAGAAPERAPSRAPRTHAADAVPPPSPPPPRAPRAQAYSTPAKRIVSVAEPEFRPWPQDPSMAAAAAAASLAAAAGLGQPPMGLHPLHAAAPFGLPFGLPPAFALFNAECLQPAAAQAAATQAAAAAAAAAAAYGLRPGAGGREPSGGSGGTGGTSGGHGGASAGAHAGSSDDASADPLSAKARRAAALKKFQAKRASRCFTKKIRYTSRKQLAEARPRNRGQFVRVKKDADEPGAEEGAALLALAGCSGGAGAAAAAAPAAVPMAQ
jgi:hypothetical protein